MQESTADLTAKRLERQTRIKLLPKLTDYQRTFKIALLRLVIFQVIVVNGYLLAVGTGRLHVSDDILEMFVIALFAQIMSVAYVVSR